MNNEKLAKITEALFESTKNGNIVWKESDLTKDAFVYSTENATIELLKSHDPYVPNPHDNSYIEITIYNSNGTEIEKATDSDLSKFVKAGTLEKFYDLAKRKALDIDNTLDSILNDINKIEPVRTKL